MATKGYGDDANVTLHNHGAGGSYTIVPNELIRGRGMSPLAKDLAIYLLSLPDTWRLSVGGLVAALNPTGPDGRVEVMRGCGEKAIRAALDEVERFGYLRREQTRGGADGRYGEVRYHVYDAPQEWATRELQAPGGQATPHPAAPSGNEPQNPSSEPSCPIGHAAEPCTDGPRAAEPRACERHAAQGGRTSNEKNKPPLPPREARGGRGRGGSDAHGATPDRRAGGEEEPEGFAALCAASIKPVGRRERERAAEEYRAALGAGHTPPSLLAAYAAYADDYRRGHDSPRYAKRLSDWLRDGDGLRWYAPGPGDEDGDPPRPRREVLPGETKDDLVRRLSGSDTMLLCRADDWSRLVSDYGPTDPIALSAAAAVDARLDEVVPGWREAVDA